ncbi:sigma-70 family RNA polymerase sigma factor [Staphylococcus gallinarum]|uniref:sigma-70 family RNA polymerase sigma factor n=2 Tax=Staphylococcus gallinarum TaxID=1293 RepID=UPI000D1C9077|nr:sigma-70 family RNA polymerase sigma factor [Staphylococcus gallinarum]MCD8786880.1 sigma-70 family RNA polymerase sigma factor [Staphylococcus gallinarum]MCD8793903.1 sigma-70 family RNA polymerase sigma factor [Staphylococcus gallinarum]MCD8827881.1 sigma-70 family RNA polymerase sigma factor [Staphylococcus gallinarum]MCD8916558.1 sigma-70 family RNA polymerase sigma factor [Staphylococcus gallinarum]MDN6414767.1 sigma-70 family RNA polymerase sigma factor [Staphylococcus gallinarum]
MIESKLTEYNYIIATLLNKYHIKYNYDEFAQLLFIRMWELIQEYNPNQQMSLKTFLFTRLNFYLIDLFRSIKKTEPIDFNTITHDSQIHESSLEQLSCYNHFLTTLSRKEQYWLKLKLAGYKQKELAKFLNCSISTLKNYQKSIKIKYLSYYTK